MHNVNDPFLVTSPLGITSMLKTLLRQKTLVRMRIDHYPQAIITTVLDVNPEQGYVVVDAGNDDNFNQRLTQNDTIHFDALVDKIRIQFSTGQARKQLFEDRGAFRLPYPDTLKRLQRRNHFRIETLVSMPLFCEIPIKGRQMLTLSVKDISAGGVALRDPDMAINEGPGSMLNECLFDLDEVGTVITNLRIRRISNETRADLKNVRILACEFDDLSAADTIMVQNYIGRLDRLLNARRRGFD